MQGDDVDHSFWEAVLESKGEKGLSKELFQKVIVVIGSSKVWKGNTCGGAIWRRGEEEGTVSYTARRCRSIWSRSGGVGLLGQRILLEH